MNEKMIINQFAEKLIIQKRKIRSLQYLINVSFICLSIGIILSLPLRYYMSLHFKIPLVIVFMILIMASVYGLLGLENPIDALKEADERLGLNEKLSAAFQFSGSGNPYSQLLLSDAHEIINGTSISQVYRVKISKRDAFQPFLLALFLFFWMSSFSFLQISDANKALGEFLLQTSSKIDAVNSNTDDKDIRDISEEYKKLGKRIQDQFMNDRSIEDAVEKLSRKLEKIINELSREAIDRQSRLLSEDQAESEIFQLNRKKTMSEDLSEILQDFLNTFSISPGADSGEIGRSEGEYSVERALPAEDESEKSRPGTESSLNEISPNDEENSGTEDENDEHFLMAEEGDMGSSETTGSKDSEELTEFPPLKEQNQSGEFDEETIRGDLRDGEQMKSFIRALPHIVDPTLRDLEVIHFYRNQLETAIDKEILPENYQSVVREYFLSIGVLNE